jgi:serine/threonine-protein kinase
VKVVDFGIATTTIASVHTSPGIVRGKASYMSPEQCLGDRVDLRSDIFALGVVLYELTTGARCFHGKTDFERMLAVVRADYIAPSDLVANYPPELEHVIRTALASDPDQRFASAAAMIEALEHLAIAHGWVGGPGAIERLMHGLFGEAQEAWASHPDDAPVTEPHSLASLPSLAEPTRPERRPSAHGAAFRTAARFARRSAAGARSELAEDLDERTRGRGPLRRPARSWLAA